MLVKYPGLTVVGGLAMAFGICTGTVIFHVLSLFLYPSLPLPQGDRLVQIRNWDVAASDGDAPALHDFNRWRTTLQSVSELGAWRDVARNLLVDGDARPVQIAEITPSAFRVTDATPLMGRVLTEADERPAAPAVAVIGYDIWRTRFGSDPAVLGRSVQLGTEHVTVVGVLRGVSRSRSRTMSGRRCASSTMRSRRRPGRPCRCSACSRPARPSTRRRPS
jgi:hypothetical protein